MENNVKEMIKKGISTALSTSLLLGSAVVALPQNVNSGITANAATSYELEENDSFVQANSISLGNTVEADLVENDPRDFYKVTLTTSGCLTIATTAYMEELNFYLYDSNGDALFTRNGWSALEWNRTTQKISESFSFDLTSGTYYICYEKHSDNTGGYSFKATFTSSGETFKETGTGIDNSMEKSHTIKLSTKYKAQIADNDDKDFYKVTIPSSGSLKIDTTAFMEYLNFYLYNSDGEALVSKSGWYPLEWNKTTQKISDSRTIDLTKGTYYICYEKHNERTGNYNFTTSFKSAGESFAETGYGNNNSMEAAKTVKVGSKYFGQIALNDDKDFYKFTLSKSTNVKFNITAFISSLNFYVYDSNGTAVYQKAGWYPLKWNETSKKITFSESVALGKGTYFVCFEKDDSNTGNYQFSVSNPAATKAVKLNKTSVTLAKGKSVQLTANQSVTWSTSNSSIATVKNGKVTAKKVGTVTITAKAKNGKKATCKVTVKNLPTKVKLNKTKATIKKGKTLTLKATVTPSKNVIGTVKWSSSNKKIATVNSKGKITAKKAGIVTITVKTTNGKTAKCKITVKK